MLRNYIFFLTRSGVLVAKSGGAKIGIFEKWAPQLWALCSFCPHWRLWRVIKTSACWLLNWRSSWFTLTASVSGHSPSGRQKRKARDLNVGLDDRSEAANNCTMICCRTATPPTRFRRRSSSDAARRWTIPDDCAAPTDGTMWTMIDWLQ